MTSTFSWKRRVMAFCQDTILSGSYVALRTSVCSMALRPATIVRPPASDCQGGRLFREPHGVAVTVEAVSGINRVPICGEDPLAAGKGTDEEEKGGAREVEVREERIDRAEAEARHDDELGAVGAWADLPRRVRGALQGAHGRR